MSKKNEWDLDSSWGGFSPQDAIQALIDLPVYNAGEDKHGHEIFLGARFPKGVSRWVDALLGLASTPYKMRSDVVRDAIYIGLMVLNIRHLMDPRWLLEEKLARINRRVDDEIHLSDREDELVKGVKVLCSRGRVVEAQGLVREWLDNAPSSSGDIMRRKLLADSLGYLLAEAVG